MQLSGQNFNKRTYTVGGLINDASRIMLSFWTINESSDEDASIDRAFSERIMLAVTQVNDCRYCDYGHSVAALRAGVTQTELDAIREGDLSDVPENEIPALLFAQHYASQRGSPDSEALEAIKAKYGEAKAGRILLTVRMITLGNLLGNTFDALLSRVRGQPASSGNVLQELSVLVLVVILTPVILLVALFGFLYRFILGVINRWD
jgi:AhpD family alkylhydroperoxidase